MTVNNEILDDICSSLSGTCLNSVEQECENRGISYNDLTLENFDYIDEQIFNCEECGWWCDTSELNDTYGEQLCDDCYQERKETDEERE